MPGGDILFPGTVFPDPRSRLGRGNLPPEGIHRTQTDAVNRNTVRECRLQAELESEQLGWGWVPHILRGASSSRRMGWLMKISRAFVQRNRISYSASWTCFPGRLPRTRARLEVHCL